MGTANFDEFTLDESIKAICKDESAVLDPATWDAVMRIQTEKVLKAIEDSNGMLPHMGGAGIVTSNQLPSFVTEPIIVVSKPTRVEGNESWWSTEVLRLGTWLEKPGHLP